MRGGMRRYEAEGLEGIESDRSRSGRPRTVTHEVEEEIVEKTIGEPPPEELTRWTSRLMGRTLGIDHVTIWRVWRKFGLKPHQIRRFKLSRALYTSLAQAHEQARITEVRNTPVITVVERPEVPVMADPRGRLMKLILGVILGGMLGVFLAFMQEYLSRARAEEDDDYQELTHLWSQSWAEIRTLGGRIGARSRAD